ncbi:MAG TPA: carbamate kinase [Candidatus Bathyarchaeia archaeon]|nr:carbamate kinase [Candidatus Bathyarchaeia archaeon]
MKKKLLVIALGGNAIQNKEERGTFEEQLSNVTKTMEHIAELVDNNKYQVTITHGNGPQVGIIMIQNAAAAKLTPEMPMYMCGAMSQGQIGYLIGQSLTNIFKRKKINKTVATIITQTVVDKNSPGFKNPTKPVGPYYSKKEAEQKMKETGFVFKEDAGRGWRRVVPSPQPLRIVEIESIRDMVKKGIVVVSVGGGGIPVVENKDKLYGVDAVIDKDRGAALLGENLKADMLIILTAVEKVCLNFGKPNQKAIDKLNLKEVKKYLQEGHFAEGSMKPKIEAIIAFIEGDHKRQALVTHANTLKEALVGKNGTLINY